MEKINFSTYDKFDDNFWYIKSREDLLNKIFKKFSNNGNLKILDLGCGTGFNYPILTKFGKVYGIDVDDNAINSCKKKGFKNISKGNAEELKTIKDNFFDVVVSIELIEHLDDIKALSEINRVLKSNGLFIGTTPAHNFLWSIDDDLAHHKRRYSKSNLKFKLNKYFNLELLKYRYFLFFLPAVLIFFIQKILKTTTKQNKNSLEFTPKLLNNIMTKIMKFENFLIINKIPIFFGIGFVFICRKK